MQQIKQELMEVLACPKCKQPVVQQDDTIVCTSTACGLRYPIRDGIPVMLVEEAVTPDAAPGTASPSGE